MQVANLDILWVLVVGSIVLLVFAVAYIVMLAYSHRRLAQTQRLKFEEVRKSEEKFKSLFDNSLAGMMRFSVDTWTISEANEALMSLSGCSSLQELQRCTAGLPDAALEHIKNSLKNGGSLSEFEIQFTRLNGDPLWVLFSARKPEDDKCAQAVVVDITKRKQFEEQIREQGALLEQTQDAIFVVDYEGKVTFWNSGAELMYGWPRGEIFGRSIGDLLYHDSKREDYAAAMEDIRRFKEWNGEQYQVRKDGREIRVSSRWRTIEKPISGKLQIFIVNSDITEKKRLEAQYVRAQKMESIALLTGGMAHDLQNILAPVAMSVPLLRTKVHDEPGQEILKAVEDSANSGLELVKNILTYGRGIAGERVAVDVIRVLDQVLSFVTPGLHPEIRVERNMNRHQFFVLGDSHQLQQVFLNLCVNARDSMPSGGLLTVDIAGVESEENILDDHPDAEPGPYVVVTVADTGKGIPEEDLDRIFEPFFTTKEEGSGTGLGLSIAQGIVKSHQGYITVRSAVGSGTTFRVYLPALVESGS